MIKKKKRIMRKREKKMEKQNKIDFFLKEIQRLSKSYQVDKKQVYAQLIKFGIPYEERTTLKEFFPTLIKENLNPKNLDVFVDERHSYFCQFKSKDCSLIYEMNPYKIYIPLKKQNSSQTNTRHGKSITLQK